MANITFYKYDKHGDMVILQSGIAVHYKHIMWT